MSGEQAARRLVRNVNLLCTNYRSEFAEAVRLPSPRLVAQANRTRASIEEELPLLRAICVEDEACMGNVQNAVEHAERLLDETNVLVLSNATNQGNVVSSGADPVPPRHPFLPRRLRRRRRGTHPLPPRRLR